MDGALGTEGGRDAGDMTQLASLTGLACLGSPVCREGVGRQVEGVDPPFLVIIQPPGGRTPGVGSRSWFQGPWPPSRLLWGSVLQTPVLSDPSFRFDECQTQERAAGKLQTLPACPSVWFPNVNARGLRFSPLPLFPPPPPRVSVSHSLTHTHTHTCTHPSVSCAPMPVCIMAVFQEGRRGSAWWAGEGTASPWASCKRPSPRMGDPWLQQGLRGACCFMQVPRHVRQGFESLKASTGLIL